MNSRLIKQLTFDFLILYPAIAMVIFDHKFSSYAENAISFFGIFTLVVGTLCLFITSEVASKKLDSGDTPKTKYHSLYCNVSTTIEVVIFASLGWYWCALGFIVGLISMSCIDDKMKEK